MRSTKHWVNVFGFKQFLPGQADVIDRLIHGDSVLAVFPTGQGKSLCYQLTALHFPGLTLVVSPLMALMKDQVDFLHEKQIPAARLDSSLSQDEYATVQKELTAGRLKLLFVAPERFANEGFLANLKRHDISMLVIDEAHCISEWGHNFRPDYLKLADLKERFNIPVTLCLTATATPIVARDVCGSFDIKVGDFIQTGFHRPNLTLRFSPSEKPFNMLVQRLQSRPSGATIVYVTLRATAEKVAEKLREKGLAARSYHAGLDDEVRKEVQEWFMAAETAIVVATIAFGMGIDKADIRYVYHYNLPKSLENYTQEIGRAGRDGKEAVCEVLGNFRDLIVLENFSYGDTPEAAAVRDATKVIIHQPDRFDVSVYELAHQYDMRPLVINTWLTYLELEKVIGSTGPFYTTYKFNPQRSSAEILAGFDQKRADFLRGLFSCAQKAKKWFGIDIDDAMKKLNSTRERIVSALNYLKERGDIELQVSGIRRGFKVLERPGNEKTEALISRLIEKFSQKEAQDIKRLGLVVDLIGRKECQTGFLLDYFGEQLPEKCGHCEFCLSGNLQGRNISAANDRSLELPEKARAKVKETLDKKFPALTTIRQQTRFFCGLSSPQTVRAGLLKHRSFGLLADQPFQRVREWLGTL